MKRKVALITGASSGIGKEFAFRWASQGYDLILTGRRQKELMEVAHLAHKFYGSKVKCHLIDFTDTKAFEEWIAYLETLGPIDVLVNNAGYGAGSSFTEGEAKEALEMIEVHIKATVRLCHLVAQGMKQRKGGTIINVSSLASFMSFPSAAMYCGTKSFLTVFTRCLAMELKSYGIRVQALCPGFTRTDFHGKLGMEESTLKNKGPVTWMSAKEVVNISYYELMKHKEVIVIPGFWNKVLYQVVKWIPRRWYEVIASIEWKGLK